MIPVSNQNSVVQTSWRIRLAWIAVLCCTVSLGALTARAFTATDADALFQAHSNAFYQEKDGRGWFTKSTDGGKADYWMWAEQLEMVVDAYERTKNPQQMGMFTNLFRGFLADHGRTWESNPYNDDILWMVIACTRAHLLTGNREFRDVARANFDLCYTRAISTNLGGGLWWKVGVQSKNACVNGPGAIAAFLLGKATGEKHFYTISTNLFLWERETLFDPSSGRVADSINANRRVNRMALTYNQGTFVGAANFLGFTNEAMLAATFMMTNLCRDGMMPISGENGDGGGFNGIGARWVARFMKDRNLHSTFEPWLQKNADAAWKARRASDNLSWCRWPEATAEGKRFSWGCSSAVVLLQVTPPSETAQPANAK